MGHPDRKEQIMAKLQQFMASRPEIIFTYLFGSIASGTDGRLSDADVAIYVEPDCKLPGSGYGYKSELMTELSSALEISVDVVVLNNASTFLKYQVIKNGTLINCRSNRERMLFHEKTIRDYLDLKPLLKVQRDYMQARVTSRVLGGEQSG